MALQKKLAGIRKELECIVNGELCLEGSLNEEYDDWYCSMDEEFLYEDPEGVVDVLTDACDFVHQCIDCEEYKAGYEIAEILIGLEITVDGEYQEYTEEPVRMDELEVYHLGGPDYKSFVMDALCVAYCANPLEERPGALYRIIINSRQVISPWKGSCREDMNCLRQMLSFRCGFLISDSLPRELRGDY